MMASAAEQRAVPQEEQWVHLHIPMNMQNVDERRFCELFEALPNGMKTSFCKSLLVDSVPELDVDLDLMLAKFIRETKFKGKPRGRPKLPKLKKQAPVPAGGEVAASKPVAATGSETKPVTGSNNFDALAGGKGWSEHKGSGDE